ncbi:dethiobiotin synthase [Yunchengibacter salinarum]|uniref:dethiobiotin synthase n=1 Tax=Yunchengibacter salinarum TaxID=3133399 RepID=UPI0035B599E5
MTGLFITSTGTDIGKTLITAALIRQRRARGLPVTALKPVISGLDPHTPGGSDTDVLMQALGESGKAAFDRISPLQFRAPLAPEMAARREGRTLSPEQVLAPCRAALADHPFTLIEGVGGALVPVVGRWLVADWIKALNLPSLLVTGSYLGTLSHTLATLEAMHHRGLPVRAIVVSESAGPDHPDLEKTAATLRGLTDTPVITQPRLPDGTGEGAVDLLDI